MQWFKRSFKGSLIALFQMVQQIAGGISLQTSTSNQLRLLEGLKRPAVEQAFQGIWDNPRNTESVQHIGPKVASYQAMNKKVI